MDHFPFENERLTPERVAELRKMTPAEKLAICFRLFEEHRDKIEADVRHCCRDLPEVEIRIEVIRRLHGDEVADEVGPWMRERAK